MFVGALDAPLVFYGQLRKIKIKAFQKFLDIVCLKFIVYFFQQLTSFHNQDVAHHDV